DRLLADPEIRAAHEFSVTCHRARIAELHATETYQRFYAELTGARMQKLCRMQQHFGSAVFAAGPGVIPPDLHEGEKPADFFFTVDHASEAEH
ncbi:MAG: glycosyltransferase family 2 protein, partial [Paracoccaceae bacterium]|nr:glycosyltransferase family 2 protein [Paracoccaceae bacterium]